MKKSLLFISALCIGLANGFAVNPCQVTLTSAFGTDAQTVCIGTLITDITYMDSGTSTSGIVTGLPMGLLGSYSAGVFTISGTPTVAGTFNYSVTTTGGCSGSVNASASGSITVDTSKLHLTSVAGTNHQNAANGSAITSITYQIGGSATGATVSTLPTGITSSFNAGIFTISGTPSALTAGSKHFSIVNTTGGGGGCAQKSSVLSIAALSCTPDPNLVTTGAAPTMLPDTNNVIMEKPDSAFSQTFSVYVPVNFNMTIMGFAVTGKLDSIHIDSVTGIPSGFHITCGTPDCIVYAGQTGCFTLIGTMPHTNNILYKFGVAMDPYGLLDSAIIAQAAAFGYPVNPKIEMNGVGGRVFASYKVQVGTPTTPTGIQSFDINQFSLSQNKPNPFDASTTINFNCPVSSKVDFVVVDVLGRQVYDTNINAAAGANTFTFNSDLASGTYFFSVSNGTQRITRKMIVTGH